jgi:anion-transporting  ArsA/GET3 family ATPase
MSTFPTHLLHERRVLVCVGAGGVGKTTTSAALGVAAARAGRRALLLTIDPANRLADALGLPPLSGVATAVPLSPLGETAAGTLTAMRLDARATFDGLVRRLAPSPAVANAILANRLYVNIAGNLSASESYMAVEKLYELATAEGADLIILDTPPTEHALDFLDAPRRILDVLNSRVLGILQNPATILTSAGSRLSQVLLGPILRALEQFTGLTLLRDVAEFVRAFDGMVDGLRERAAAVQRLLRDPATAFVLVTAPSTLAVQRTEAFYQALEDARVPCAGLIVNRVLPREIFGTPVRAPVDGAGMAPPLAGKLAQAYGDLHALALAEYQVIDRLRSRLALGDRLVEIPAFSSDVASLRDVVRMADLLTRETTPAAAAPEPRGVGRL